MLTPIAAFQDTSADIVMFRNGERFAVILKNSFSENLLPNEFVEEGDEALGLVDQAVHVVQRNVLLRRNLHVCTQSATCFFVVRGYLLPVSPCGTATRLAASKSEDTSAEICCHFQTIQLSPDALVHVVQQYILLRRNLHVCTQSATSFLWCLATCCQSDSKCYLEKGIQTFMVQGRSTQIISMIVWIRTSRLSIKNSPSLAHWCSDTST